MGFSSDWIGPSVGLSILSDLVSYWPTAFISDAILLVVSLKYRKVKSSESYVVACWYFFVFGGVVYNT